MLLSSLLAIAKVLPGTGHFLRSERSHPLRHWYARHFEKREWFNFTQFLRLPTQFAALTGPVLDLVRGRRPDGALRVVVLGCSTGEEPYSISSVLLRAFPELPVVIEAYDLDEEVLRIAATAHYPRETVLSQRHLPPWFVSETFDQGNGGFTVKKRVAGRVVFGRADLLEPDLPRLIRPAEIVCLQNVLCNMQRTLARQALRNILPLLGTRSALFADGMDPDMRARFTQRHRLAPLDFEVERIHNEARWVRGDRYPWCAAGLPPYRTTQKGVLRYHATVFLREATSPE